MPIQYRFARQSASCVARDSRDAQVRRPWCYVCVVCIASMLTKKLCVSFGSVLHGVGAAAGAGACGRWRSSREGQARQPLRVAAAVRRAARCSVALVLRVRARATFARSLNALRCAWSRACGRTRVQLCESKCRRTRARITRHSSGRPSAAAQLHVRRPGTPRLCTSLTFFHRCRSGFCDASSRLSDQRLRAVCAMVEHCAPHGAGDLLASGLSARPVARRYRRNGCVSGRVHLSRRRGLCRCLLGRSSSRFDRRLGCSTACGAQLARPPR
jgi:hypothetical protein